MSEKILPHHPWLLCIHNIPPKPSYLRAKAARRLAALGAVPLKNAVYLLPDGERQRDALLWLTREIEEGGGRAFVCGAGFDLGESFMTDTQVKALFIEAREAQRGTPQKSDRCDSYSTRRGEHTCPSERIMPRLSRPEWP